MRLSNDLVEAAFIERLNRFAALVNLNGVEVTTHVANSGRLRELFIRGSKVYLTPRLGAHRKTAYDLSLVDVSGTLVSCDARLPNFLTEEAIRSGTMVSFQCHPTVDREVTFEDSRLDIRLSGAEGQCFIETKSITLVVDGTALFPDAPTSRGTKHVGALASAVEQGHRAAAVFVIQREDAVRFAPHEEADKEFSAALRQAVSRGVEAYAYKCRVSLKEILVTEEVPVCLR